MNDLLAVVDVFSEELMLDEYVFALVTFELLLTVSWLFVPRDIAAEHRRLDACLALCYWPGHIGSRGRGVGCQAAS